MSFVSIIIPIYNAERYLKECIDSIINQSLKDIEIICVNDGSKDNSLEILEEYAKNDKRIIIIDKENGGYASAINVGLDSATSEFIGIVESDDICDLNMYEELYNQIKSTDADYIVCDFYFLYNSEKFLYTKSTNMVKPVLDENNCFNLKSSPNMLLCPAYPWKNLYRKSFLDTNKIRMKQDGNGAYEDQPWNGEILSKANKILYLDKCLYYYRTDAFGSSTNNGKIGLVNYVKRRGQTRQILIDNNLFDGDVKEYFYASSIGGCKLFFRKIHNNFKPQYYKSMKEFLALAKEDKIEFKYFDKTNLKDYKRIQKYNYALYTITSKFEKISRKIFSIINSPDRKHKTINICGIKINIKRNKQ